MAKLGAAADGAVGYCVRSLFYTSQRALMIPLLSHRL